MQFKSQFEVLRDLLKASGVFQQQGYWAVGGGAALELAWNHRLARDLDVFFYDPMIFAYLSPRVNDFYDRCALSATEGLDSISFRFRGIDLNLVCTATLTDTSGCTRVVDGTSLLVETPHEVIARKIHYRSGGLTANDITDILHYLTLYKAGDRNSITAILINQNKGALIQRAARHGNMENQALIKNLI